jgi:malonyl-CoA O-methyltransferase
MTSNRSAAVAKNFGAHAASYDDHAGLQRIVAKRLASLLPQLEAPSVLELGCGTGLFSRELLARYPDGSFVLSDLSPSMLEKARANLAAAGGGKTIRFALLDANIPDLEGRFDLIAMSMTLHWLADPRAALKRLRGLLTPRGALVYATIGTASFPEWRDVLARENLPSGLIDVPELPGIADEERLVVDADALSFLRRMQAIGGLTPKEGYVPLSAGALRRAIRQADVLHGGRITWHIVYGRLGPLA